MNADSRVEIGSRPVPQEPMVYLSYKPSRAHANDMFAQYLIVNLGMSRNFGTVDLEHLTFPATMKVDYIRVYQDPSNKNVGCDPIDFPTAAYINECVSLIPHLCCAPRCFTC